MKHARRSVSFAIALGFLFWPKPSHAGEKSVTIESTPSGAQVDVNGSITCTTPCTLSVSGAYFGSKHTVWSSRIDQPLSIRLLKEGFVPKDVVLTAGPHVWRSIDGQNSFEYYLMSSDHFNFRLEPIQQFLGQSNQPVEKVES